MKDPKQDLKEDSITEAHKEDPITGNPKEDYSEEPITQDPINLIGLFQLKTLRNTLKRNY